MSYLSVPWERDCVDRCLQLAARFDEDSTYWTGTLNRTVLFVGLDDRLLETRTWILQQQGYYAVYTTALAELEIVVNHLRPALIVLSRAVSWEDIPTTESIAENLRAQFPIISVVRVSSEILQPLQLLKLCKTWLDKETYSRSAYVDRINWHFNPESLMAKSDKPGRKRMENIAIALLVLTILCFSLLFLYQYFHGVALPSSRFGATLPRQA